MCMGNNNDAVPIFYHFVVIWREKKKGGKEEKGEKNEKKGRKDSNEKLRLYYNHV